MKTRLFLDTNSMLDFLGERHPFYDPIAKIVTLADQRQLTIVVSALSCATVSYFLTKCEGNEIAYQKLRKFKLLSGICDLSEPIIEKSLDSHFPDFEDALLYFSAISSDADILITRNGKDFKNSSIPVLTADKYLKSINKR